MKFHSIYDETIIFFYFNFIPRGEVVSLPMAISILIYTKIEVSHISIDLVLTQDIFQNKF